VLKDLRERIAGWNDARDVFANTGWLILDNVARMALTLGVSIALARSLGPQRFGMLKYAMALVALCSSFTNLGLYGIVVRELTRHPEEAPTTLGSTSLLYFLGSTLSFLVCVGVGVTTLWDAPTKLLLLLIFAIGVLFHAPRVYDLWFQYKVRSKYAIYAKAVPSILSGIAVVVAALLDASLTTFAILIVADTVLAGISLASLGFIKKDVPNKLSFAWAKARYLLSQSWPLILSKVAVLLYLKIDQVMLHSMLGEVEVGVYAVAVEISEVWYFIPSAVATSAFPGVIKVLSSSREEYERRMQDMLDLMVVMAIGIMAVVLALAGVGVDVLYGEGYEASAGILRIHIFAAPFIFMGYGLSKSIIAEGYLKFSLVRHVMGAVVNIGLNLFLIPRWGGYGAAIATVLSYATAAYLSCAVHPKARRIMWLMSRAIVYPIRAARSSISN